MRSAAVVLAVIAFALPAAAARRRPPAPPPVPKVMHSADVPERKSGPLRVRELINETGKTGAASMLLISLPRGARLQGALDPKHVALIYILEGEVHSRAPANKRKRLAAIDATLSVHDALYTRPPLREGWELVGSAELSRLVVLRAPLLKPAPRGRTFDPLMQPATAAQEYEVAAGKGAVKILFEPANAKDRSAYVGRLRADHGLIIPEHVHAKEAELLFIYSGFGEMALGGKIQPVSAGDAIYIPPNTPHSFKVTSSEPVKTVQFYTPSGPEQRFKKTPLPKTTEAQTPPP